MAQERDWHAEPLETLGLSVRPLNCLRARGIETVGQLCCVPTAELLSGQSWGETTLKEARSRLATFGLRLYDDWADESVAELGLPPSGLSLMRELRVTTVGELLRLSADDLFRRSFREAAVRDVLGALGRRGLRLPDAGS